MCCVNIVKLKNKLLPLPPPLFYRDEYNSQFKALATVCHLQDISPGIMESVEIVQIGKLLYSLSL